jgi:hypothetical protein
MVAAAVSSDEESNGNLQLTQKLSALVKGSLEFALEPLAGEWKYFILSSIDGNIRLDRTILETKSIHKIRESVENICGGASEFVFIRMSLFLSKKIGVDVKPEELKDIAHVLDRVAREIVARESPFAKKKSSLDDLSVGKADLSGGTPSSTMTPKQEQQQNYETKVLEHQGYSKGDLSASLLFLSGEDRAAFEDLILKVCDETLEILGQSVRQSTYHWLRVNYEIEREEIPENFPQFIKAVQSIYGYGARVILIGLATTLRKQFGIEEKFDFQDPDLDELLKIYREAQNCMMRRNTTAR